MSSSVTIVNVNSMQPTYDALGLGPIAPGTRADVAVATVEKVLFKKLKASWPASAPQYDPTQQDSGIMGPWSQNVAGTAPPCVVQQITIDFNNWSLPNDQAAISSMAQEITQQIQNNGGLSGSFYGKTRLGGSETLYWAVGFGTGVIVDNPEEMGVIFVYTAALAVNEPLSETLFSVAPPHHSVKAAPVSRSALPHDQSSQQKERNAMSSTPSNLTVKDSSGQFDVYLVKGIAGNSGTPGAPILHFALLVHASTGKVSGQVQITQAVAPPDGNTHITVTGQLRQLGFGQGPVTQVVSLEGTYPHSLPSPEIGTVLERFSSFFATDKQWNGRGAFSWGGREANDIPVRSST